MYSLYEKSYRGVCHRGETVIGRGEMAIGRGEMIIGRGEAAIGRGEMITRWTPDFSLALPEYCSSTKSSSNVESCF